MDGYNGMLENKTHCKISILPNHCVVDGEQLCGFTFFANPEDHAKVLPINSSIFECICLYECIGDESEDFNTTVLEMLNDLPGSNAKLQEIFSEIQSDRNEEAKLDAMHTMEMQNHDSSCEQIKDSRDWKITLPSKVGLYHAFVPRNQTCKRQHKLYIVIRGSLTYAAEELYNLWHDSKDHISCKALLECDEFFWLRCATQRNHSKLAYMIAKKFNLKLLLQEDIDNPNEIAPCIGIPSSVSFINDIRFVPHKNYVQYVSGGCFTDISFNGIVFDTEGLDGFWIFSGPIDTTGNFPHGMEMRSSFHQVFPTSSAKFATNVSSDVFLNNQGDYVMPPDENFMQVIKTMAFDRNNPVIHLIPLIQYTQAD